MYVSEIIKKIGPEWGAILVALFLGLASIFDIRSWFFKPKLKIKIDLSPPDCHKIPLTNPTKNNKIIDDVYYLRFCIKNEGNREARDVQVMVINLNKFENSKYKKEGFFLPLNLIWSHIGGYSMQTIPANIFRHCDLGYLTHGFWKDYLLRLYHSQRGAEVILKMDTIVEPNTGSHIIFPGKYRLTIYVSASNAKTIKRDFEIELKDEWYDLAEDMFSKGRGISIKEL